jgi:hypothetical protein
MQSLKTLDGKTIAFEGEVLKFTLQPSVTGIGYLSNGSGYWKCSVQKIDNEGLHWVSYFLGTIVNGIIHSKHLNWS